MQIRFDSTELEEGLLPGLGKVFFLSEFSMSGPEVAKSLSG